MLQGERPMAADNKTLGRFTLDGIPPAPRGVPQIEVTFDIDADGILHVSAKDKATGREQKITITASSGLSKDQVSNLTAEAEQYEAEDRKRKEVAEARNAGDSAAYSAEKTLKELGDKVPADLKSEVQGKVDAVRSVLAGSDADAIKRATESLMESLQKVGAAAYQQEPGPGEPSDGEEKPGKDEETVEGEFREV